MSDQDKNIDMMRKLVEAKKAKSAGQRGLGRADKDIQAKAMKVTKQHKKGGLFDGK
ncbi:hypothetical protein JJB07_04975 [Tumebacillus sp. ITR2]|uniref:Uncharacterized protein n=1 Tax=Tumebacillus amylolyticus TaxID=2801339 RepID=A0ABS1J7H4_9BACL|nr:hypothetical protein [Tumebacillus amylolyticus]MBL0385999.1 hypothetical protein [Tumebacillus amylolyticus]